MAGRLRDLLTLVLLVAMATTGMHCLTCRDENGQPVDWFVVYKLPSSGPADGGRSYVYRSSGRPDVGDAGDDVSWIRSERKISDAESLPGRTLEPLYEYANEQAESHLLLMYNDELPNGTSSGTAAHAKGVVAFDRSGGFWLLHSVPRFPPTDGPYDYPPTGTKFGQTMLCISLPFRLANDVGVQLTFYDPLVYKWRICDDLIDQVPDLAAVGSGQRRRQPPPGLSLRPLTSLAGAEALSFAKSARFGKDLYADWMAPTLQSSLLVETWTNGDGHVMPSDCRAPFKVHNVQQVNVTPATNFSPHRDHSKWAVARRSAKPWICIADINRMDSQRRRGGGSICLSERRLQRAFLNSVAQIEGCPLVTHQSRDDQRLKVTKMIP